MSLNIFFCVQKSLIVFLCLKNLCSLQYNCLLTVKEYVIKISLIIPVYNENKINNIITYLLKNSFLYEIIVVDGNQGSTLKLITNDSIIKLESKKGRAKQMNAGAKKAKGDVLVFLHADTFLPKNGIEEILKTLHEKEIVAGAFDLSFNSKHPLLKIISGVASWRSRLTRLPYGDQCIFIKKEVFDAIKGYEEIDLMEDVNLMQKLKKNHFKIKILKSQVITSARKWEEKGIFYTTLRNWLLISLYLLGVSANKLAKYYR